MRSRVANSESRHLTLEEFTSLTRRNTTGVELGPNVRRVLGFALGFLLAPYVLWVARPLISVLWFGDGVVATWVSRATSGRAMLVFGFASIVLLVGMFRPVVGTGLLTACALSVVAAGFAGVPTIAIVGVVAANLIAVVVGGIAVVAGAVFLTWALLDQ